MNILYVINSLGTGGAENQLLTISKCMINKGNKVVVISLKDSPDNLKDAFESLGIKIYSLNMDTLIGGTTFSFFFNKIILKEKIDIIHAHLPHAILVSRFCNFFTRKKLVSSMHTSNELSAVFKFLFRATDFLSDINTNVSKNSVEKYIRDGYFSERKTVFMPNGFFIENFDKREQFNCRRKVIDETGFNNSDYICIAVSRLAKVKNHRFMIDAFEMAFRKNKRLRLIILGDGEEKNNILNHIKERKLQNVVKLLGNKKNVYSYFLGSDLYLLTSIYEGMPLTMCEAMIANLPVITTRFLGVEEFIFHNTYPLIDQENVESYSDAIQTIMEEDNKVKIDYYYQVVSNKYDIENICEKWLMLYTNP